MTSIVRHTGSGAAPRLLLGFIVSLTLLVASTHVARAAKIIPSIGYTRTIDDNGEGGQFSGGLALRVPLSPILSAEGGISYRDESLFDGDIKVRMWPVSASLWLTPGSMFYLGGGLGWYFTSFEYDGSLSATDNSTSDDLGIHVGGGMAIPLSPSVGLDLNMRYVFLQQDNNLVVPSKWDPDFWSTSAGLAFKF
jgi:Outer membrane protein beta-barrel domain